jgi:hypothetical protein
MAIGYRDKPSVMRERNYGIVALSADILSSARPSPEP